MLNSHFDLANGVPPLMKQESYENECTICVTEINADRFKNTDQKMRLTCIHTSFHNKCLMQWLSKNPTCPICSEPAIKN